LGLTSKHKKTAHAKRPCEKIKVSITRFISLVEIPDLENHLILQRDLSGLSLPSTLAIDLKRTLSMGTIGRIVSHLMIPDDFKSPIEIKNRLPQGDGQQ
jgi:hypothetical protein